jgi:DNA-binding transcriptional regulator YiaG
MKQTELAALLGVNPYTLRSWEQKKTKPPYHAWRLFKEYISGDDPIG